MKWEALKVYALFITGNDKQITQNQKNPIKQIYFYDMVLCYGKKDLTQVIT